MRYSQGGHQHADHPRWVEQVHGRCSDADYGDRVPVPRARRRLWSIRDERIHVNNIDMNVVIAGEGPDVLLVHGFPDTHKVRRHVIPALVSAGTA
jgi:hypothetical protein